VTHLAFIIPTIDEIGGGERQVLVLARAFSERGWRVTLITLSGSRAQDDPQLAESGVTCLSLKMRKAWIDPRGWLRYLAWAARNRLDIVHAHLPHATWFARCMRLFSPIRVHIDTIHTSKTGSLSRRLAYRLTHCLSNRVTCVSKAAASAVLNAGMVRSNGLLVIPNGVPVPPRSLEHPSFDRDFYWIAVGRLAPVKDYPTLLKAFAGLPETAQLTIVGAGPEEEKLRALSSSLNIADRVHFAGFHRDIHPLLNRADAFVQSSLWEGLPTSILEASAAGLAIAATNAAGTCEATIPGHTAVLVPIADIKALEAAMTQIMQMSSETRAQMGWRGRQFVEQNYALPTVVDAWHTLYNRLLAEQPTPSRFAKSPTRSPAVGAASTSRSASTSVHERSRPSPSDAQSATQPAPAPHK